MEQKPNLTHQQYLKLLKEILFATYICKATPYKTLEDVIVEQPFRKEYELTDEEFRQIIQKVIILHEATLIFLKVYVDKLYNIKIQINPNYGRYKTYYDEVLG